MRLPKKPPAHQKQPKNKSYSKLTFLSANGPHYDSTHPSIHHFCTGTMLPQLPVPAQVLSRQLHAKQQLIVKDKCKEMQCIDFVLPPDTVTPGFKTTDTVTPFVQSTSVSTQNRDELDASSSKQSLSLIADKGSVISRVTNGVCPKKEMFIHHKIPAFTLHGDPQCVSGESMGIAKNPFK